MSCNGCRVLRKGCSEECMLRQCLIWIHTPQAQSHATLFVAKFFGRAALMSFLSSVPPNHRSALFHSLLYEAVARTINPVNGAVGLLWTGNWHLCQLAVHKVLTGDHAAFTNNNNFQPHQYSGPNLVSPGGGGSPKSHRPKKPRVQTRSEESETSTLPTRTTTHNNNINNSASHSQTETNLLTLFF